VAHEEARAGDYREGFEGSSIKGVGENQDWGEKHRSRKLLDVLREVGMKSHSRFPAASRLLGKCCCLEKNYMKSPRWNSLFEEPEKLWAVSSVKVDKSTIPQPRKECRKVTGNIGSGGRSPKTKVRG